jgi:translation initiation factor IF-1
VEVRGWREGNIINADSVRVISAGANTGTNPGERLTLSGVVTQNVSGNDFYFRANDGRPFRVRTRSAEPRWIVAGARIEVRGLRDRNERDLIYADSLRQLSNQNSSVDRRVSFLGTVSRLQSQTRFNVLAKDGRTYTVSATGISHSRISVGDRVRVVGLPTTDRTTIAAESVTMVSDGNTGTASSTANGTAVNFPGRIDAVGSTLRVRGDNGQSYVVRFSAWQKFRVGDRVRVIGTVKNGVVTASSVTNL